jgi:hypothetical protein
MPTAGLLVSIYLVRFWSIPELLELVLSSALGCEFNRSMQHLASKIREEDVAYEETSKKNLSYTSRKSSDVGSLEIGRLPKKDI